MFKRRRLLVLACGVPLILAGLVYAQQTPAPLATTHLPGGRVLTLHAVTHGHGIQYWYGGTRWQRWLGGHLHPSQARLLGLNPQIYSAGPVGQDPDQLLFWATASDGKRGVRPNGPSPYYFRALLLDDDGCAYTQHVGGEDPIPGGWREHFQWSIWPHRSGTLRVRLYVQKTPGEKLSAPAVEWVVPNPAPPHAAALNSGPVPVEAEAGPLHVVLTRLERIQPPPSTDPLDPFAPQDGLRAVFRVWENGRPAPGWRLSEVVLTDPTGNIYAWGKGPAGHYTVTSRGELVAECFSTVPPHEHVSRLTVRLARAADIDRDVAVSRLPLPQTGPPTVKSQKSALIKGQPIHFECIRRVQRAGKSPLFSIEYSTPLQSERDFYIEQVADQSGRRLKRVGRGWTTKGNGFENLEAPSTSHTATLTLRTISAAPPRSQQQAEMVIRIPQLDSPSP